MLSTVLAGKRLSAISDKNGGWQDNAAGRGDGATIAQRAVAELNAFTYNVRTISSHVTGEKPGLPGKDGYPSGSVRFYLPCAWVA
jgi:hypothetical protein